MKVTFRCLQDKTQGTRAQYLKTTTLATIRRPIIMAEMQEQCIPRQIQATFAENIAPALYRRSIGSVMIGSKLKIWHIVVLAALAVTVVFWSER